MRISRLELLVALISTVVFFVVLAKFAPGGPLGTDVMGYVNHGINGVKDPTTITRYFHTYFQGIFTRIAPTPLVGVQYYWAFIMAFSTLLIYLNARMVTYHASAAQGLLAILLFWSIRMVAESAGVTQPDFSAMFICALIVFTYLISARKGHNSKWLIGLLGFLLYLGFRAKEVLLCTGVLVIGLGMTENNGFQLKSLFKKLGYLIGGLAVGMVLFVVLNTIFLQDPLFGWRWSDYQSYYSHYSQTPQGSSTQNWLTGGLTNTSVLLLIFLLYIISGIKTAADPENRVGGAFVWLVPVLMVAFLAFTVQWGRLPFRYLIPPLAMMASLGVQVFKFDLPVTWRGRAALFGLFSAGMLIYLAVRMWIKHFMLPRGWQEGLFLEIVLFPIILTALLGILMALKKPSTTTSIILIVLVLAILASNLTSNFRSMFISRPNQEKAELVFYPLSAFASEITVTPGMRIYMASNTWNSVDQYWIAKNHEEKAYLFNVYFDSGLIKQQVTSPENSDISRDILLEPYDYVLMQTYQWERIRTDAKVLVQVERRYEVFTEPKGLLVLLKARNP